MTLDNTAPRTCTHSWHVDPDGFPFCKGDDCDGFTVACGQGLIPCPRHAAPAVAAATIVPRVTDDDDDPRHVVLILTPEQRTDVLVALNTRLAVLAEMTPCDYADRKTADLTALHDAINGTPTDGNPMLTATVQR